MSIVVRSEFLLHFRIILPEIFKVLSLSNLYPQNRVRKAVKGLSPFEFRDVCKSPQFNCEIGTDRFELFRSLILECLHCTPP
jgi:hypothetical protein